MADKLPAKRCENCWHHEPSEKLVGVVWCCYNEEERDSFDSCPSFELLKF